MSQVLPLTDALTSRIPTCCASCVFWQTLADTSDGPRRRDWNRRMERGVGSYGRAMYDGERFLGLLQYGPARAFPRARTMPAGPPDPNAALLSCAILAPDDPAGTCERLVLEALADLKGRGVGAAEAFAITRSEDEATTTHQTLFDREALEALGFGEVRSRGAVALMRIELGGLLPARTRRAMTGVLGRLWPAPDPVPRPV
ncbi:MAG TPA: hypothetical protein VKD47_08385 [Miltoncostaeaceae bacterium]|nr:hypothetical protein [Miltoncostaeaceae bacterium]